MELGCGSIPKFFGSNNIADDNATILKQLVHVSKLFIRVNVYDENGVSFTDDVTFFVECEKDDTIQKLSQGGYFKVTPGYNIPEVAIEGANVEIGATLTAIYKTNVTGEATMRFTRNGNVTEVTSNNGLFAYEGINAQCMGDTIKAELIVDGKVVFVFDGYSLKDYAIRIYGSEGSELDTLLADMLAYGAASQKHTGYKTDELVTDGITWATSTFDVSKLNPVRNIEGNDKAAKIKSVGVNISNVYKLYFKFEGLEGTNYAVKLNGDDVTGKVDGGVLYTDAIKATENAKQFKVELLVDGEVVSTVTYNLDSYINQKYQNSTVVDIVKAIANYGQAAVAYQATNNIRRL